MSASEAASSIHEPSTPEGKQSTRPPLHPHANTIASVAPMPSAGHRVPMAPVTVLAGATFPAVETRTFGGEFVNGRNVAEREAVAGIVRQDLFFRPAGKNKPFVRIRTVGKSGVKPSRHASWGEVRLAREVGWAAAAAAAPREHSDG